MNEQPSNELFNPNLIDSLNHPLAGPIRKLLTREGRRELNQILIDAAENIPQALGPGVGLGAMILLNTDPFDLYDRRLIRASRGYRFSLPSMAALTNEFPDYCKAHNETLLATAMEADKTVDEIGSIPERFLSTFGAKGRLFSGDRTAATLQVRIPISDKAESLNVSAAAGITLLTALGLIEVNFLNVLFPKAAVVSVFLLSCREMGVTTSQDLRFNYVPPPYSTVYGSGS